MSQVILVVKIDGDPCGTERLRHCDKNCYMLLECCWTVTVGCDVVVANDAFEIRWRITLQIDLQAVIVAIEFTTDKARAV